MQLVEQSGLAKAGGAFDLDQRDSLLESATDRLNHRVQFSQAPDEADGMAGHVQGSRGRPNAEEVSGHPPGE